MSCGKLGRRAIVYEEGYARREWRLPLVSNSAPSSIYCRGAFPFCRFFQRTCATLTKIGMTCENSPNM